MQITVSKEINYVEEVNSILVNYINSHSYEKMKQDGIKIISYGSELYNKRFQNIIKIYNYVIENMRFEKSRLEYFFKEIANSGWSLSNYFFPMYTEVQYNSLNEYKTAANTKSKEDIARDFDYIISQHYTFGKSNDEKKDYSLETMIRLMENGDFPAEDKWKIIQAYLDYDKQLDELSSIFNRAIQLLKECDDEIKVLEKEFYDYWLDYTNNHNFLEELQKRANANWKYSELGNVIIPSIFLPLSITISFNDDDDKKKDVIHVGIVLDSNLNFRQTNVSAEDLNNALKLLSDRSKFEILRYIKDKPAYGFEIANELNLSTSTISYHMNGLIQAGLIKLEKEANKIYYSINKTAVKTLLEDIEHMLLQ